LLRENQDLSARLYFRKLPKYFKGVEQMKIRKKTAMLASFALGTLLFASTALADIVTKSGYDQLKDALKLTAENCSEKFDSFTLDYSFEIKDNGKTLVFTNNVEKYDRSKSAMESITNSEEINRDKVSSYYYSDKTTFINNYSESDPTWYVTEYIKERKPQGLFNNPFKENESEDIEKIADALVGSLKDYVVVTENPDGSKLLSGSLTEMQIPPLVNAVASFATKQEFNVQRYPENPMPRLTQDIFVKEAKGTALLNKDSVIENILGTAVLSGKDEQGQIHNLTIEVLGKLTDINSTTVSKPDLTGKKVVKQTANSENFGPEISNPQKYIGKFKNDILIEKEGKFVKIGERCLEITYMDNKTVIGKYYEEYKQEFEEYAYNKFNFSFEGCFDDKNRHEAKYEYTNQFGAKKYGGFFFDSSGKVHWNGEIRGTGGIMFDSTFSPDLD
jgi:hypothetical protein